MTNKQYVATLFVADKELNKFMQKLGLKPDFKVFYKRAVIQFSSASKVDKYYFFNIINKSKENPNFWIPAIEYKDKIFVDDKIKILSDGKIEIFR